MSAKYQVMPPLPKQQRDDLRRSIEKRGVVDPIKITPDGEIIDGYTRKAIATKLGVPCPEQVLTGYSEDELLELAVTLNLDRRHLTKEERAELHRNLRREWRKSEREIAKMTNTPKSTVHDDLAAARNRATETDPLPDKVEGADGKKYPAHKAPAEPKEKKMTEADKVRAEQRRRAEQPPEPDGTQWARPRSPRATATHDQVKAAVHEAIVAITRALNNPGLDVEFIQAEDAMPDEVRLDAQIRRLAKGAQSGLLKDLLDKLQELRQAAKSVRH